MSFASVLLDLSFDKPLDYAIPPDLVPLTLPGVRVSIPLRGKLRKGTVIAIKENSEVKNPFQIAELLTDTPLLSKDLLALAEWISQYYATPLRRVIQTMLPPAFRKGTKKKLQWFVKLNCSVNELTAHCDELRRTNPAQAEVLDILLTAPQGMLLSQLLEKSGASESPVKTLVKKKILLLQSSSGLPDHDYFPTKPKKLNDEQEEALNKIKGNLTQGKFQIHLLHGVTGSGKTEVYLQAIDFALHQGKGALFLVPEIALTSQMIEKLKSRFQEKVAILHHRMSDGERHEAWTNLRNGTIRIAIGARSSLFSPIQNLGLIIVDEEHEPSYKQSEEMPCYHARDGAIMRGKFLNATVILGSATPSLETRYNAELGKYHYSRLTNRADHALLPKVDIVDMKIEYEKNKGFTLFSEKLLSAIKLRYERGEQILLFLNRRGYHSSQVCPLCSNVIKCPHCEISLTFHRGDNLLACHLCDYRLFPPPKDCPSCGNQEMKRKGAGTEQVERALHAIFPNIRTLRADADTTRHKGSHELLFQQFRSGKADVLIGTQMIAKGLHFPSVTLVGILNPDSSLQIPDFRASEHLFQLLTQVAGRSGRGALPGEVIIQTSLPEHETIALAAKQDDESFFNKEIEIRKIFAFPPLLHLIKIIFSGEDASQTLNQIEHYRNLLISKLPAEVTILPVVPCGHKKIQDRYRFQFLLKSKKISQIARIVREATDSFPVPKELRLFIDVDPLHTYF